ncbi:GGDEF domain-containing protein [Desulfosporosinus sp. Sb-LF]|uniref:GGDEF domain-containing protein n=1 Tax=Desulfosporosinus sp. Sb-LF TaxID=2560027 RepID=UPI001FB06AF6|nr:GGDEF domain-containing protein [Desulfosporosinus sp. Sb-LF]
MNFKQRANTDFLTGLYNRRYIDERLKNEFNIDNRTTSSLLMLDLDHFKRINDTYGHDQGDFVLKSVARLIKQSVRDSDFVGRFGGEEFIVVMPGATRITAHSVAERIRLTIENERLWIDGKRESITISIGISTFIAEEPNYRTSEEWIQDADRALYTAKNEGRNRVV